MDKIKTKADYNADDPKEASSTNISTTTTSTTERIHSEECFHCLTLCDTSRNSAPIHLQELFKNYELKNLTKAEVLYNLVYLIALESGFAEQNTYQKCISQLHVSFPFVIFFDVRNLLCLTQHKPIYTFDPGSSKFRMKLESIASCNNDTDCDNLGFILSGIVTGDLFIVTLTPIRNESPVDGCGARSICLTIPRYVLGTTWTDGSKVLQRFLAKMDELSNNLREVLFCPAQNTYLDMLGAELYPALTGLPDELYDHIFHCLSSNQLRILANVNKKLNQLVINSKHYKRQTTLRSEHSFLSPSQSRHSFPY